MFGWLEKNSKYLQSQKRSARNVSGIQKDDIIVEVNDIPMKTKSMNKITKLLTNIKRINKKLKP